jgi:hypothetical protein
MIERRSRGDPHQLEPTCSSSTKCTGRKVIEVLPRDGGLPTGIGRSRREMSKIPLQPFVDAATTRAGLLSAPLRNRLERFRLEFYSESARENLARSARILSVPLETTAQRRLRAPGTPRIANRLLRRVRDFADALDGVIRRNVACEALKLLDETTSASSPWTARPRRSSTSSTADPSASRRWQLRSARNAIRWRTSRAVLAANRLSAAHGQGRVAPPTPGGILARGQQRIGGLFEVLTDLGKALILFGIVLGAVGACWSRPAGSRGWVGFPATSSFDASTTFVSARVLLGGERR